MPVLPGTISTWAKDDPVYTGPAGQPDPNERRTRYKHDEDEIVYSRAFRRLSGKSQIVVKPESQDHFRSRLTHTLEVQEIASSIGQQLGLCLPLIHAIALGHDLGHSPFGHAGERAFQDIVLDTILPLVNEATLKEKLQRRYATEFAVLDTDQRIHRHCLFHHALNAVSVIERKGLDISEEVKHGIRTHSWAPWQRESKFGIPKTYEAQAVAIADQVASINHDTEDILACKEVEHGLDQFRNDVPGYIANNHELQYAVVSKMLDEWLLPHEEDCNKNNSYGRKRRLQKIINRVADTSLEQLNRRAGARWTDAIDEDKRLGIELAFARALYGYEKYIRDEIIQKVSWFGMRDAVAGAVVRTVYMFFIHYRQAPKRAPEPIRQEVVQYVENFQESVEADRFGEDKHFQLFLESASPGEEKNVEWAFKALQYVAGMTDACIMKFHVLAFEIFK